MIEITADNIVRLSSQVGAATYQAVFGALSAVPLILAWLYACWAVLLLISITGGEVCLKRVRQDIREPFPVTIP